MRRLDTFCRHKSRIWSILYWLCCRWVSNRRVGATRRGNFLRLYNCISSAGGVHAVLSTIHDWTKADSWLDAGDLYQKKIRASCIEAMGHLVEAVGDSIAPDAYETFNMLMSMIPTIAFDDPALNSIKEVSPLFASCLKEQFAPFIQPIF